jgi:hypothetical protein
LITGKLRDTETVMRSLEVGGWKSANTGNSLATYPTSGTVSDDRRKVVTLPSTLPQEPPRAIAGLSWKPTLTGKQ